MGRGRGKREEVVGAGVATGLLGSDEEERPDAVNLILDQQLQRGDQKEEGRKTKRKPHEVKRAHRQLSVTFPAPEWKDEVLEMADRWGVRTSDFLTFCVAYTMQALDSGKLRRVPRTGPIRYHHRAGEALDLPWSPDGPNLEEDSWV